MDIVTKYNQCKRTLQPKKGKNNVEIPPHPPLCIENCWKNTILIFVNIFHYSCAPFCRSSKASIFIHGYILEKRGHRMFFFLHSTNEGKTRGIYC